MDKVTKVSLVFLYHCFDQKRQPLRVIDLPAEMKDAISFHYDVAISPERM